MYAIVSGSLFLDLFLFMLSVLCFFPDRLRPHRYAYLTAYCALLFLFFGRLLDLSASIRSLPFLRVLFTNIPLRFTVQYVLLIAGSLCILCLFQKKKILYANCIMLGWIAGLIFNFIYTNRLSIPAYDNYWIFYHPSLYTLLKLLFPCCFTLYLLLLRFLLYRKIGFRTLEIPVSIQAMLLAVNVLCIALILTPMFLGIQLESEIQTFSFLLMSGTGLFFLIIIGLLLFTASKMQKEALIKQRLSEYDTLQEYTNKLETVYQELRIARHDYSNILSTLYGFIEADNLNGLRIYFKNHLTGVKETFAPSDYELGLLSNIHIPELKGLFVSKLIHALHLKLKLHIDIPHEILHIHMDILDVVRILGIYLDNAIEAADTSSERLLHLSFWDDGQSCCITIGNSCSAESLPLGRISEFGYSTKGENRGIGLFQAERILCHYPDICVRTAFENHYFTQTLRNI